MHFFMHEILEYKVIVNELLIADKPSFCQTISVILYCVLYVLWCLTQKIKTFEESGLMFAIIVRPELLNVSFISAS